MDWMSVVKTVAPWIGTAISGPLGGMAVEALASALGVSDKTAEGLKAALSGVTPEQMAALKKADQDFALQMQDLGFKNIQAMEALAAGDRADARKMQTATHSRVPGILTAAIVSGFGTTLLFLCLRSVPIENKDIIVYMIGQLSGAFTALIAFWVGTTRDSGRQTELLAQSTPVR